MYQFISGNPLMLTNVYSMMTLEQMPQGRDVEECCLLSQPSYSPVHPKIKFPL